MREDLTVVYYTANFLDEHFLNNTQKQLLNAIGDLPLISVSKKPIDFGHNICVGDTPRNLVWVWRQALVGAKEAKTKYIALAEDDVFYSPDHFFCHTPTPDYFAYNTYTWSIHIWDPSMMSWTGEVKRMYGLVCERDLFIETIEELFAKYPNDDEFPVHRIGEPGRYEKKQGTTLRKAENFHSAIPNVVAIHPQAIGYQTQGEKKKHRFLRATAIPHWGSVEDLIKLCQN